MAHQIRHLGTKKRLELRLTTHMLITDIQKHPICHENVAFVFMMAIQKEEGFYIQSLAID